MTEVNKPTYQFMVREYGLSPDELFELIAAAKKNPIPSVSKTIETEEENSEE